MNTIKRYAFNPITLMVIGGALIGMGIDAHKAALVVPGIAILVSGFALGFAWLCNNA